jgi:mRNA interferase MazF
MKAPRRGEVWRANLNPTIGHEQAKTRPVLVLSVDSFNTCGAQLITILPVTSKPRALRTRVDISPPEGGCTEPSQVIGEQVRTISIERLSKRLGSVSIETMARVSGIVRMLLGL